MSTLGERVQAVEFDHPFTIVNGDVVDVPNVWAPSVLLVGDGDDFLDLGDWEPVSSGWTGQYSYSGPVMHSSEYIGDRIADRLTEMTEDYRAFAVVAVEVDPYGWEDEYTPEELADYDAGTWQPEPAGWMIVGLPA